MCVITLNKGESNPKPNPNPSHLGNVNFQK